MIIRSTGANDNTDRLRRELSPAFGNDVFLIVDRFRDETLPEIAVAGCEVTVGRKFLTRRQLPYFERVGWQCGDFAYYAAAEALPGYDYYLVIEDDLSFCFDEGFFEEFLRLDFDVALSVMSPAADAWMWAKTMKGHGFGPPYKCYFPISCVSAAVARHLLGKRRDYSSRFTGLDANAVNVHFANDEAFVATVVKNDGFRVARIEDLFPDHAFENYTLDWPTHPAELDFMGEGIIHPVCVGAKSRRLYRSLLDNFVQNRPKLIRRYEEFSQRVGADQWLDFTGLDPEILQNDEANPTVALLLLKQSLQERLRQETAHNFVPWIYNGEVLVFDLHIGQGVIAFDVSLSEDRKEYRIEVFARQPTVAAFVRRLSGDAHPPQRILIASFPANVALSLKADEIFRAIHRSLARMFGSAA